MFTTASETTDRTLARLIRAMDNQHPVTITYTKADGTETLRTIEIHDVTTTKAGNFILRAIDRESGEKKSWRLDRISHYTIHRTAYTVPVISVDAPTGHGLVASTARVAHLTPATVTLAARINALTQLLTTAA